MSNRRFYFGQRVWVKIWKKDSWATSLWITGLYRDFYHADLLMPHVVQLPNEYRRFCNTDIMSEEDYAKMALVQ